MFYVAFGLSSVSYVGHGIVLHGWETQLSRMSLDRMGQMAIVNLVGATIYAARVSHRFEQSTSCRVLILPDSRAMGSVFERYLGLEPPDLPYARRLGGIATSAWTQTGSRFHSCHSRYLSVLRCLEVCGAR
jgi:hypothetical protein